MLQKITQRSLRFALQRSTIVGATQQRFFGNEIIKSDALAQNIVAQEKPTAFEIGEYDQVTLKDYFDQDALLFPIEEIIGKVGERDYKFFLSQKNFFKVVDTLEKFQHQVVDLDSQAGRDFIVFKRQLYQLYEIQNRSVEEHEAFSFQIERQNLKWLYNANQDFTKEMDRASAIEDLEQHASLKGKIFKRKMMDPKKVHGLGYFGLAGMTYAFFPHVALHIGYNATMLGLTGSLLMGMTNFQDKNIINTIELLQEGEHAGKLKFNVSVSPIASKDYFVAVSKVQSLISLGNDDQGEDGIENNLVQLVDAIDGSSGEVTAEQYFVLPADGFKDHNMLDWVLSIKSDGDDSTVDDLFNDIVAQQFFLKSKTGGMNQLAVYAATGAFDKFLDSSFVDRSIEKNDASLDKNLQDMKDFYGPEQIERMTPSEFYTNYKKFASGQTF